MRVLEVSSIKGSSKHTRRQQRLTIEQLRGQMRLRPDSQIEKRERKEKGASEKLYCVLLYCIV